MRGKNFFLLGAVCLSVWFGSAWLLPAQQTSAAASADATTAPDDPLAELSPENRALFDAMRNAALNGDDNGTLANGRKLLPALKPESRLADYVAQITAGAALETGDIAYALALIKPLAAAHPDDWRAAALLARLYAESGEKTLRDAQIAHLQELHKQSIDPVFAKLHFFPIQNVKLHSGYAVILYPFEPLKPYNTYLIALIYGSDGKEDYRIELGSEDEDQAFFHAKHPGERRFSIDSYRKSESNPDGPETQALHGFVDGVFDYDYMRDCLVDTANGDPLPRR